MADISNSEIEQLLAPMLKRVRGIPFYVVVKALSGRKVLRVDKEAPADRELLNRLASAVQLCAAELRVSPITRTRPNEVGNDLEAYVMRACSKSGLTAERPTALSGHGKSSGYPDILVRDHENRPTYLECKIFTSGTAGTTMRSFYLSPSESFKVSVDARHLLLAFEMEAAPVPGSQESQYTPKTFKVVDLHDLPCDVKYEFNSDNRRLYGPSTLLMEGQA